MKNFLWLLQKNPFSGTRPFSCECVVPPNCKPDAPALLAGGDLWIGVRKNGQSGLAARLRVAEVSEFKEGIYDRHLLVSGDPALSLWISAAAGGAFFAECLASAPAGGVCEISGEVADALRGELREDSRVFPAPHRAGILRRVPVPSITQMGPRYAAAQLALARKHIPYEDIHRWAGHPAEMSPHESVALSKVAGEFPAMSGLADVFAALKARRGAALEWTNRVDNQLRDIDPEKIAARKFIAGAPDVSVDASLRKTEKAEQRHQRILHEVAVYLSGLEMRPQESRSIDLAIETEACLFVAEIKSATMENFLPQGSKGLFQAMSYAIAMRDAGWERVVEMLIIEKKGADGDIRRLSQVGEKCGVRVFLYDEDKPWPGRVEGLADVFSCQTALGNDRQGRQE